MRFVFYVSGHGFGHSSRAVELINAIAHARPDSSFVVRTSAPAWLFARATATVVQPAETDTGAVQIDSLNVDEDETARRAAVFYRDFDRRVRDEAGVLRALRADIAIGDVPPLAFAAAASAGIRSVAVANFTWDWIYESYPAFDSLAPDVIPAIQRAYSTATLALRLPLHGGFAPMTAVVRDIPLIARQSQRDPGETRRLLGIAPDRVLALSSFGAYGVQLPIEQLKQSRAFSLLTFDRDPPHGLKYEDVVAAADVVVTKPGYGIVSECVANDTALLYTSRGHFAEYDVFVAGMPPMLRCRYITNDDLIAGRWAEAIGALLSQPKPVERARIDGARVAAQAIVNRAIKQSGNRVIG